MADDRTRTDLRISPVGEPPADATARSPGSGADDCRNADSARPRSFFREYGGFLAAGALAATVLVCSATTLSRAGVTWYPGDSTAVASASPAVAGSSIVDNRARAAVKTSAPTRRSAPPTRRPGTRTASSPAPRPTPSPALLGPSDVRGLGSLLNAYCQQRYDRFAAPTRPWRDSGAERNWACLRRRSPDVIMIDMTDACRFRYGRGAAARFLDARDPYSWRCYGRPR